MAVQNSPKPQKRRKGLKITLSLLLVFGAVLIIVGVWQKNNLDAVLQYTKYSQEELEEQLRNNDSEVESALQAALEAAKQVDAEGEAKTETNVVSPDPVEQVQPDQSEPSGGTADTPSEQKPETVTSAPNATEGETSQSTPETGPPQTPEPAEDGNVAEQPAEPVQTTPTYEAQLQAVVDKAYALRTEYLQALDDLQAEAVAAYKAIPADKRTTKEITAFVNTYIGKATELEKTCDGKMDALVGELTQLQKKYGQSMELVSTMKYTYANEKSLKKAWYMSELEKKGLT